MNTFFFFLRNVTFFLMDISHQLYQLSYLFFFLHISPIFFVFTLCISYFTYFTSVDIPSPFVTLPQLRTFIPISKKLSFTTIFHHTLPTASIFPPITISSIPPVLIYLPHYVATPTQLYTFAPAPQTFLFHLILQYHLFH